MKKLRTLVIGCHEHLREQYDLLFVKASAQSCGDEVVWQEYTTLNQTIDLDEIKSYDRILLVFQLTHYMTPSLVNHWCEQAFSNTENWQKKEIGAIVLVNEAAEHFRAGAAVGASVDQLLLPLQTWATRYSHYLTPLVIYQWMSQTEKEKQRWLIRLQQYMMLSHFDNQEEQAHWYCQRLQYLLGKQDCLAVNLCHLIEENEFQLMTMDWI